MMNRYCGFIIHRAPGFVVHVPSKHYPRYQETADGPRDAKTPFRRQSVRSRSSPPKRNSHSQNCVSFVLPHHPKYNEDEYRIQRLTQRTCADLHRPFSISPGICELANVYHEPLGIILKWHIVILLAAIYNKSRIIFHFVSCIPKA